MIRKQREQLARLFAVSDALAVAAAFFISFWLRFHSGLLRVPKGMPRFSSYLIVIPFLLFIHMVYFSYQGFYRFKLRRNRLDDLFSVILNCMAAAFTVLLIFSYLKSYRFTAFEISHVFLAVYAPFAVLAIVVCRAMMFRVFRRLALARNGVSRVLIAGQGDLAELTAALNGSLEPGKPTALIAKTRKGRGVSFMEDVTRWHHGVPNDDEYARAQAEIASAIDRIPRANR